MATLADVDPARGFRALLRDRRLEQASELDIAHILAYGNIAGAERQPPDQDRLNLKGESMRKRHAKLTTPTPFE
jgi:hypothetical protein